MKASVVGVLAVVGFSGLAQAATPHILAMDPIPDGVLPSTRASNSVVFSAMTPNPSTGQYSAFAAGTGGLGFDDYNSTFPGTGNMFLQTMRFVGGVAAVNNQISFEFYDTNGDFVNSFTITFPSAGNSIYTIGLESVVGAKDSNFQVPADGYLQLVCPAGSTGQWFLATPAPTVGTESRLAGEGSLTTHSHRFELTAPAPGSLALLGLGGLVATRRRR